jgi:5-methylcytosine-specific restriction protein A
LSPFAAPRPCAVCRQLNCTTHTKAARTREYDKTRRPKWLVQFYSSARWKALRRLVLVEEPLCRTCKAQGAIVLSAQADHIKPIHKHPELMLVRSNLQGLCLPCHRSKTRREETEEKED